MKHCSNCNSTNVWESRWVNLNTGKVGGPAYDFLSCFDCCEGDNDDGFRIVSSACVVCSQEMPDAQRGNRLYCGDACKQKALRSDSTVNRDG